MFCNGLSSGSWIKVYASSKTQQLKKNKLLTWISKLNKEWRVSFEVNPTSYRAKLSSVLHMTAGGKGSKPGDQTPAVWFHKRKGILVAAYVNGTKGFLKTFKGLPNSGEWIKIEISQVKAGTQYLYSIAINGEEKFAMEHTKAEEFSNVGVFASSPYFSGQKGLIRNVTVENKADGKLETKLTEEL